MKTSVLPTVAARLRELSRRSPPSSWERCELCRISLGPEHRHLFEMQTRRIVCACEACALRFQNAIGGRFKLIPRDVIALPSLRITEADWETLALPINLVFIFHNSLLGKVVAMYPSPAGATESLLPLPAWATIVTENPALETMEADVQAFLANRVGSTRKYFLAPIDVCYELVGMIRLNWRGLSGGETVWNKVEEFFAALDARAISVTAPMEVCHA